MLYYRENIIFLEFTTDEYFFTVFTNFENKKSGFSNIKYLISRRKELKNLSVNKNKTLLEMLLSNNAKYNAHAVPLFGALKLLVVENTLNRDLLRLYVYDKLVIFSPFLFPPKKRREEENEKEVKTRFSTI